MAVFDGGVVLVDQTDYGVVFEADGFVSGEVDEGGGGRVEVDDVAAGVDDDDAVADGVEGGVVDGFGYAGLVIFLLPAKDSHTL